MNINDFKDVEYINLITYKKDGSSVTTPVWVAPQVLKAGITHTEADINQFDWQISGKKISWSTAISIARNELGITGFKPIKKGTEFYDLAKKYYTNQ